MWDLPKPGIELVSPTLAGRFITTGPPGKSKPASLSRFFSLWWFANGQNKYVPCQEEAALGVTERQAVDRNPQLPWAWDSEPQRVAVLDDDFKIPWSKRRFRQMFQVMTIYSLNLPDWEWGFPGGSDGKESTCNAGESFLLLRENKYLNLHSSRHNCYR